MAYIFMDESWDLSFKNTPWNSHFFHITFLYVQEKKIVENIMKKIHQRKKSKGETITDSFFHSCHERKETIIKWLKIIATKNILIMNLSLNKLKFHPSEDIDKHELYNQAVNELINFTLNSHYLNQEEIHFIASRRETNKSLNEKFLKFLSNHHTKDKITFEIWLPTKEKWLQVVDIIAYAISKKYELWDSTLYNLICDKILIEEKI